MQTLTLSEIEAFDNKGLVHGTQKRFLCPICGVNKPRDTAHRSLAVNSETGLYLCHRCQTKGCLQEFWETRPIMSKRKRTGLKLMSQFMIETNQTPKIELKQTENLEENNRLEKKMAEYQSEFLHSPAEMYLLNRGIPTDIASLGGCGYAEKWEHWKKENDRWILEATDRRVVFPIYDLQNNLVAFHGRAIDAKYYNSSKITKGDKSQGLFLSDAKIFKNDVIAICEGAIDAMALQKLGIPAVAMTGTTPADWFYRKMIFKKVLIATDNDEAGVVSAQKLKLELETRGVKIERLTPPKGKDWGEFVEKNEILNL